MLTEVRETVPSRVAKGFAPGKRSTTKALACRFDAHTFQRIIDRAELEGDSAAATVRKLVARGLTR